jgi:hypothetical protein
MAAAKAAVASSTTNLLASEIVTLLGRLKFAPDAVASSPLAVVVSSTHANLQAAAPLVIEDSVRRRPSLVSGHVFVCLYWAFCVCARVRSPAEA